ncbi:MAG: LLM class flavin-dependent oxidoreductase [Limisphaerales bacterium]
MDLGKIGVWAMLEGMTAPETLEFAKMIEQRGFRTLWIPEGPGRDPFAHSAYLLSHTEHLAIATGIANIWARDAVAMAFRLAHRRRDFRWAFHTWNRRKP